MSTDSRAANLNSLVAEMAALTPAQQAQVRAYVELVRSERGKGAVRRVASEHDASLSDLARPIGADEAARKYEPRG